MTAAKTQDDIPEPTPKVPDRVTLAWATVFALFVAASLLFLFILPAEYGIDPTGIGAITGIAKLHSSDNELHLHGTGGAIHKAEPMAPRNDTVTIVLGPEDDNEYKFHLLANQTMLYAWTATGPVNFDFHGEPERPSRPGEFASYEARQALNASGSFQAPFDGTHGWYFQNVGTQPVSITLHTWGYYTIVGLLA
jgi:hypothetical protein